MSAASVGLGISVVERAAKTRKNYDTPSSPLLNCSKHARHSLIQRRGRIHWNLVTYWWLQVEGAMPSAPPPCWPRSAAWWPARCTWPENCSKHARHSLRQRRGRIRWNLVTYWWRGEESFCSAALLASNSISSET